MTSSVPLVNKITLGVRWHLLLVDVIGPADICSVRIAIQPEFKAFAWVHNWIVEDMVTMTNTNAVLTVFGPFLSAFFLTEIVRVIVKEVLKHNIFKYNLLG